MDGINPKDLTAVVRKARLPLEENTVVEATIWKIYEEEKTYQGESQGTCPTFEVTTSGKEILIVQSKSNSSYAMLDEWDDRKAPCNVHVWKDTTGSKTEIWWAYREK
tara:strand:+ start:246 stop:566 length:321 start_codon:yes stop_codon:yes gene_type:complete